MKVALIIIACQLSFFSLFGKNEDIDKRWREFITACHASKNAERSIMMKEFVRKHSSSKYSLSLRGFSRTDFNSITGNIPQDYEFYMLPEREKVADDFIYSVIMHKELKKFWIVKMGGFAGVFEIY